MKGTHLVYGQSLGLFCALLMAVFACDYAEAKPLGQVVNIKDFADKVEGENWSPAIQAAIDSVCVEKGYQHGATIYFPPGTYRIDRTLYMGKKIGSHGMRLSGYHAVLLGTKKLDAQPSDYETRKKQLAKKPEDASYLRALAGELDFDGVYTGNAILEIWRPEEAQTSYWQEGSSFVVEGLTFSREEKGEGVGIKIPAETCPKRIVFRDVKVFRQNVGFLSNYCWQIRIENCSFRQNQIGIWGRNHFNAVSIINTEVRRQGKHGLVIGPNVGSWGSSSIYVAGTIFEAIRGYGIANYGGVQVVITGCYFEADGNSIGVFSKYGKTTIDTNHFWGSFGKPSHGHGTIVKGEEHKSYKGVPVVNQAHLILDSTDVVLRNNNYRQVKPMMVFGLRGKNSFDTTPLLAEGAEVSDGFRVGDSYGMGVYVYNKNKKAFEFWDAFLPAPGTGLQTPAGNDEPLATGTPGSLELSQARTRLAKARNIQERVTAQLDIGHAYARQGHHARARKEYAKALKYPKKDQTHMRAGITMEIADSFYAEEKYAEALETYRKAQAIGPGGWHKGHIEERIEELSKQGAPASRAHVCGVCGEPYDVKKGDPRQNVAPGTAFEDLPENFVCPACGAKKTEFFVEE